MKHKRAFSQFLQKPSSHIIVDEISAELAKNIIEKELEFEKEVTSTVIHELISLYSKAMESYEQHDNPRYLDFQERMHKMLIKPQVLSILKHKNCKNGLIEPKENINTSPLLNEESPSVDMTDELSFRKYQAEITRKELSSQLNASLYKEKSVKNFKIIIDRHSNSSKETANRAVNDFKSQDSALEHRLASRIKKNLTRSTSFGNFEGIEPKMFECDLSDINEENISTKSSLFVIDEQVKDVCETFEKKLEEIMEENFDQRTEKINQIKMKYESQIAEFNGMGEVMMMVVEQMKINMNEEIECVMEEFNHKRKEEVQKLKDQLYN